MTCHERATAWLFYVGEIQNHCVMRGPGWCSNLVNIIRHNFSWKNSGKNCWKISPLSRNTGPAERKRKGRGRVF